LGAGGVIEVTHKTGDPYDRWHLLDQARNEFLTVMHQGEFDKGRYPGYNPRITGGNSVVKKYGTARAITDKFRPTLGHMPVPQAQLVRGPGNVMMCIETKKKKKKKPFFFFLSSSKTKRELDHRNNMKKTPVTYVCTASESLDLSSLRSTLEAPAMNESLEGHGATHCGV